ncbi:RTA1 like protein-domain-containing protein [Annulohypoxylon bovei var. microspora]|nr:RTA1 like protein-domain-containing protein [Annulohypoxylon bovei var. microspora]
MSPLCRQPSSSPSYSWVWRLPTRGRWSRTACGSAFHSRLVVIVSRPPRARKMKSCQWVEHMTNDARRWKTVEAVGFIGRAVASDVTDQLLPYIIQSVFLLVPPSLFAASIYMTLGRIMRGLGSRGEDFSIIRVRWLTTIFVVGDVFSFLVQSGGAGFMAAGDDPTIGEIIVVAGLVIQIVFFALFVAAAVIFHIRCRQYSMTAGNIGSSSYLQLSGEQRTSGSFLAAPFNWLQMMWMLYASSALILVRSVFRIIEYAMGTDAYPLNHEWTLYVFDGSLMVITMVIIYLWYPSQVPRVGKGGSTENENTIEMGQEQDQGK